MSKDRRSYHFGPFRLLPSEHLLLRQGEPIALPPKAFETLVALVRRAGRLADKEELLKAVWPDAFVEESNLTQNVFALRRALGPSEDGKPYIETVPKRGYRFVAAVTIVDADDVEPGAPTSPEPSSVSSGWNSKRGIVVATIAALLVVAALIAWTTRRSSNRPSSFQTMQMERLTTSGNVTNVAISSDGKYVAYGLRDGEQQSLWVRQTATESLVQIVPPARVGYVGVTFTPDGNYIYYNASSRGGARRTLYLVPTLGGTPRAVLEDLRGGAVSFSPDGSQFAFVRVSAGQHSALMIAAADGSAERTLVSLRNRPEEIDAPAWSPDGRRIAYAVTNRGTNDSTIFEADVAGGPARAITARRWLRVIKLFWLADGRGLVLLATPGESLMYQVWRLSYPGGEVERITNDLSSYGTMSLAAGADVLAAVSQETEANIFVVPNGDNGKMRPVTTGRGKTDVPTAWTPDGRIVYHSNVSGAYDIWITGAAGGPPRQLTRNMRVNQGPAVSPDGRYIVFLSDRTGVPHLWRMNLDGSNQRQLSNGPQGEQNAQFTPDGRWVVYRTSSGPLTIWKMPSEGGEAVQLTPPTSFSSAVSPDGKWLAYLHQDENAPLRIVVAPFDGHGPTRTFPFPVTTPQQRILRWTRDSGALTYVDTMDGVSNIYAQPIGGGDPVRITSFTEGRIFGFAWSVDGRQIAVSRGALTTDLVLIRNVR